MNNSDDMDSKMIEEYRLNKFKEMDAKLEKDIRKNTISVSKYKKMNRIVEITIHILNVINVLSAGGTVGSSGMGMLSAILPCATISSIATLVNATLQVLLKKIIIKQKKHSETMLFAHRTQNKLRKLISKFANNDVLYANEFDQLMTLDKNYNEEISKHLLPSSDKL